MSVSECANASFTYSTELFVHEGSNVYGVVSSQKYSMVNFYGFQNTYKDKESNLGLANIILFQLRSTEDRSLASGL